MPFGLEYWGDTSFKKKTHVQTVHVPVLTYGCIGFTLSQVSLKVYLSLMYKKRKLGWPFKGSSCITNFVMEEKNMLVIWSWCH